MLLQAMADQFLSDGCRLVSGGTDNHLMLVDVTTLGLTGKAASTALEKAGIVVNKNSIPFDKNSPFVTSGIRVGTPTITTRGMGEDESRIVADLISSVLRAPEDDAVLSGTRDRVAELVASFPAP